ncbi:carbohydrate sulfotransferase 6-like [Rhinatrema bivittatum]|uniref:carbohydrate sulfotransferase 6-like n=1 Tax=Rhinatrema bivittatum TaxID=194408 RepID=UPI00112A5A9E|nr:carbohydrate sulfotransferase 6-like [Rhinatrema bivittatum]
MPSLGAPARFRTCSGTAPFSDTAAREPAFPAPSTSTALPLLEQGWRCPERRSGTHPAGNFQTPDGMFERLPVCWRRLHLLGLVALLATVYYLTWKPYQLPQLDSKSRAAKTQLLILSTWRSGSSFLGQLFNQNPEVFYLLEPTRAVWFTMPQKNPYQLHPSIRDLVKFIFSCNMSAFLPYLPKGQFISELFGWHESRALCSPPACHAQQRSDIINRPKCNKTCLKSPFEKMEEACRSYSHVAVKEVRFLDLEVLYPLLRDPSLNLKIIHLVRDPRAILSSRQYFLELETDDAIISRGQSSSINATSVIQEICKGQVRIYRTATQNPPTFLKDRYRMVRFEDFVKDPLANIKSLYEYVGLTMSSKLETWVYNITHGTIPENKTFMHFTGDSKKIAQNWRGRLSFQKVKEVQKLCRQEMHMFGYQPVSSAEELRNMSLDFASLKKN